MAVWARIEGSRWRSDGSGREAVSQKYVTDPGLGKVRAEGNGFVRGKVLNFQGTILRLMDVDAQTRDGIDIVTIVYRTAGGAVARETFNDGKFRAAGDEEWFFKGSVSKVARRDAVNFDGTAYDVTWGDPAELVIQPAIILVQIKWLNKDSSSSSEEPVTLPQSKADALNAVESYLPVTPPSASNIYESNPPRIFYVLDSTARGKQYLCTAVSIDEDGDLVARTAEYEYNRAGWDTTNVYGVPS